MDITVFGRHRYVTTPDHGLVQLVVDAARDTAEEAAEVASRRTTDVAGDLSTRNGRSGPVIWQAIDPVQTHTERRPGTDETVHHARVRIRARFRDAAALAAFVGHWSSQDDLQVDGVTWELSDDRRSVLEEDALAAAVVDAHQRARTIAVAAGARDVEAVAFADPGRDSAPWPAVALAGSEAEERAPIVPADVEATIVVEGRFRALRTATSPAAEPAAPRRAL